MRTKKTLFFLASSFPTLFFPTSRLTSFFVCFLIALQFFFLCNFTNAQELIPIVGSPFYCIEFPDGSTFLGELNGDQVVTTSFEEGINTQRKRVLRAKDRTKAMNKLLKQKQLSRKDRKSLTKKIANLASSSTKGKVFLTTLKKNIKKERSLMRLFQRQLDLIMNCEDGNLLKTSFEVEKKLFIETLIDPSTGQEIVFSGVYISTKFPKKVKKKQTSLSFPFCTQYSSPDDRVNAVGAKTPSEGEVTFTSNLCAQVRAPAKVRAIDCTDILPAKSVGILLTGSVSDNGPSQNTLAFFEETTGTVSHFIQRVPKGGCKTASF